MESWMILNIANFVSLVISLFICVSVIVQMNKKKSTLLLLTIFNFCFASCIQIIYIIFCRPYSLQRETIPDLFRSYFINDSSMVFGFIYIPSIVIGTIIPLLVIVISALRQKHNN